MHPTMLRRHEARTQQSNGASRTDTATQKTQKEELATELTDIAENFRVAARKATADSNSRLCSKGQSERLKQLSTRCDLLEAASNFSFCMLQDGPWYLRQVHDSIHDADKIRAELVKTSKTTYQTTAQAVDDSQAQLSALSFKAYIFSHLDDENSVVDLGHNKVDVAFWHYGVDKKFWEQTECNIDLRKEAFELAMENVVDSMGAVISEIEPRGLNFRTP